MIFKKKFPDTIDNEIQKLDITKKFVITKSRYYGGFYGNLNNPSNKPNYETFSFFC